MEKTLSPDERIRRAEEIYYRRKMQDRNRNSARVSVAEPQKNYGLLKKMILQIVICILIYTIFYMVQNTNYIFSEDIISKTKEILSYDINIPNLYNQVKGYINEFEETKLNTDENNEEKNEEVQNEEQISNEGDNTDTTEQTENNIEAEGIGGENIESENSKPVVLSQMEQDAKDISETKSLIIPLKGTITSRFGLRDSDNPIVTKNHTGIDIAVNEGTKFISAMSGVVEEVSSIR